MLCIKIVSVTALLVMLLLVITDCYNDASFHQKGVIKIKIERVVSDHFL